MRIFRQVSVRLFLVLAALLVGALAIYVQLNYSVHREHLEQRMRGCAHRYSQLILRSTEHAMMEANRDRVGQIVSSIGHESPIVAVRIYDKAGEVVVSTDNSELGHRVDIEAEACAACHLGGDLREVVPTEELARRFETADGVPVLGFINPIMNEPSCSTAACHAHPPDQRILGVLDLQLSLAQDLSDLKASRNEMIRDGAVVALVTALGAWLFILVVVGRPVRKLIKGTQSVAKLDLDVELGVRSNDEIGDLARHFEEMARALKDARAEIIDWSTSLEVKVDEKTSELRQAQAHLVHVEKMASLGKLSAIVAHEINNPLAGVLTYARLVARRLRKSSDLSTEEREQLLEHLQVIDAETMRCGDIVKNMLLFSRRVPEGLTSTGLVEVIDRAVRLMKHGMDMAQIELVLDIAEMDDEIVCNADQIQQMLVALLANAIEAMPEGGTIRIEVRPADEDSVLLTVTDDGVGIPEESVVRVFEPFYTTKQDENGVGLGLAVVHGIVKSHGGEITVESKEGEGTIFSVVLPRRPSGDDADLSGDPGS